MSTFYSEIDYITENIIDLFAYKAERKDSFHIWLASRLNGMPHIGTLVNFLTGFILAKRLEEKYGKPGFVHVDLLDNISDPAFTETFRCGESIYFRKEGVYNNDILEKHRSEFLLLLKKLETIFPLPVNVRNYAHIQSDKSIRKSIVEVVNEADFFGRLFQPTQQKLHIRIPCPQCGLIEKTSIGTEILSCSAQGFLIRGTCAVHGPFQTFFAVDNDSYADINVPFRNYCTGAAAVDNDEKNNSLSIFVKGNDWSGVWPLRMYCEGLLRLKRKVLPEFLFTPLLLHCGRKLSKSTIAGDKVVPCFVNANLLSVQELAAIANDVAGWFSCSGLFFTNYPVTYFNNLLKSLQK